LRNLAGQRSILFGGGAGCAARDEMSSGQSSGFNSCSRTTNGSWQSGLARRRAVRGEISPFLIIPLLKSIPVDSTRPLFFGKSQCQKSDAVSKNNPKHLRQFEDPSVISKALARF
jgi:hypothetical protein